MFSSSLDWSVRDTIKMDQSSEEAKSKNNREFPNGKGEEFMKTTHFLLLFLSFFNNSFGSISSLFFHDLNTMSFIRAVSKSGSKSKAIRSITTCILPFSFDNFHIVLKTKEVAKKPMSSVCQLLFERSMMTTGLRTRMCWVGNGRSGCSLASVVICNRKIPLFIRSIATNDNFEDELSKQHMTESMVD